MTGRARPSLRRLAAIALALAGIVGSVPAHALERVEFETPGASQELRDTLTASSLVLDARQAGNLDPQDILAAARADYGRIVGALYAAGFYGGVVSILVDGREAAAIPPLSPPRQINTIRINVDPGPPFRFGTVSVSPLAPGTQLPETFRRGPVAKTPIMADAVSAAVDQWRAVGHAKARQSDQSVVADHRTATLDAQFRINPGPVVRFGVLDVTGNRTVRTDRIEAIAGLPTGEIYDPDALREAAARIRRTGTFSSAAIVEAESLGPGDTLDVTVEVAEEKPRRFGFGGGITSIEGLRLTGFWLHRNLRGGAERLRFDGEIDGIGGSSGGIDFEIDGRYTIPAAIDPDSDLFYMGEIARLDEPSFTENTAQFGVGVERRFSERVEGEAALALRFSDTETEVRTDEFLLVTAPMLIRYDGRDNLLDATEGYYLGAELTPFLGLNDSESGARLYLDGRAYYSLGTEERFVFAGRLQLGTVAGSTLLGTLPEYLFFSGGGGTVRGQDYQSLAVDLGDGIDVGGRSFLGASAEIRAAVTESIGIVGFFDTGYIGADSLFQNGGEWHSGAGIGFRYDTGIGPIRLDIAAPIGGTSEGVLLYLGIGQAF